MLALQGDIEIAGGTVVLNSSVTDCQLSKSGPVFSVGGDSYTCETLINAAGLGAVELMKGQLHGGITQHFAKGHYFAYEGKSPFEHLIYPLPSAGGLGIHATIDLGGSARFGPDVTWIEKVDYSFDNGRKADFVAAIRRYFPGFDEARLVPAYTGVRPKISGPGDPAADFVIQGDREHGMRGLVNLFGIESPGLTSSLAIGEYVKTLLA
jgi:L-2-hydroxyglutarate oxidase LhgO